MFAAQRLAGWLTLIASPTLPPARSNVRLYSSSGTAYPEGEIPGVDVNFDPRTFAGAQQVAPGSLAKDATTGAAAVEASTLSEIDQVLATFDFTLSTDDEVEVAEAAIFRCLKREAGALSSSFLTAGLARRCVLQHTRMSEALAALLSGKVHVTLSGSLEYSAAGGSRAETATAEESLRDTMARRLSTPDARRAVVSDLLKVLVVDPAADGLLQPFLFFKGFHALANYRVANSLWLDGGAASQGAALMLQSRGAELFAVDIHPAATIGNGVMLDHATGVVIGSTAVVGSDVYMLHGVTLGATGKPTGGKKRHPTVGSRVVLGAGCTVLGDIEVGDSCTVGALAIVTKDVEAGATVIGVNKVVGLKEKSDVAEKAGKKVADDYTWYYEDFAI